MLARGENRSFPRLHRPGGAAVVSLQSWRPPGGRRTGEAVRFVVPRPRGWTMLASHRYDRRVRSRVPRIALSVVGLALAIYGVASLTGAWLGKPPWWEPPWQEPLL